MAYNRLVRGVQDMLRVLKEIQGWIPDNFRLVVDCDMKQMNLFHSFVTLQIDYLESLIHTISEE